MKYLRTALFCIVHPFIVVGILLGELMLVPLTLLVAIISIPFLVENKRLGRVVHQRFKDGGKLGFTRYENFIINCLNPMEFMTELLGKIFQAYTGILDKL